MLTKQRITEAIWKTIESVTSYSYRDEDLCLVDRGINIPPVDFLYIFEQLEIELELPIHCILATSTYEIMTVRNLVTAIFNMAQSLSGDNSSLPDNTYSIS